MPEGRSLWVNLKMKKAGHEQGMQLTLAGLVQKLVIAFE